ncbi:MAG: acetyl-CoA C-acyltransferase [Sphingobacteriales bacterium]|nr:MAG: acetyl-CoA C-acyltransferase [Sphingobacteriales bacterium]
MEAYIIAGLRTAVGKAPRGVFRFTRADDLAANVIRELVASVPNLNKEEIDDVIVGNATPEAEQGLNIARMISLMGLDTDKVPGVTINRYCASGLDTIATAVAKIKAGMADCIVAGGVEIMSGMPFGGWKLVPNPDVAKTNPDWYWGMGLTAEAVAKEYNVSREDQDEFSYHSHRKAVEAIKNGHLTAGVLPITVNETYCVEPIARLVSYGIAGVPPRIMGIGPIEAIPKALKQAGLKQDDMDLIELNEAFASQSLAIIRTLGLDQSKINVNGGAIALGHPLGCTGAKLSVQIFNELKRQNKKYGMVTMCVGTGQGAAGIFEVY